MKSNLKVIAGILTVFCVVNFGFKAGAEEKTKEIHSSWTINSVEAMKIENKFGNITINNYRTDSVTVDVVIVVEAPDENRADELLELIDIEALKNGSTVDLKTLIDSEFKTSQEFSINYVVNIPFDKNLEVSNKYGNTTVNILNAGGSFDIQHGNFTAYKLDPQNNEDISLNLVFGKADITAATNLEVNIEHSTLNIEEITNLVLNSDHSAINIEEAGTLKINSNYDSVELEEAQSITAETRYSHLNIEELKQNMDINAGYGGLSIEEISSDFEFIVVENSYGQISLGLDDLNYSLDASCEYCGISFPGNEFSGDESEENNTRTVKGRIGLADGGRVDITSRYGEIKLQE